MIVTITPSKAYGHITAPPSKSMAHRLLICAGCAGGTSKISNVDFSEDILATLDCLQALGAQITCEDSCVTIRGIDIRKISDSVRPEPSPAVLSCRESGSTLRFMLPLCLMSGQEYYLTGSDTLFSRPLSVYEKICREQGLLFEKQKNSLTVGGNLSPGNYVVPGNISSQFISGLLFALPILEEDSTIHILPPVESRSYINLTLQALQKFGIEIERTVPADSLESESGRTVPADSSESESGRTVPADSFLIRIPGRQKYRPQNVRVEGDYSNAAFFEALNLTGGNVRVEGLVENSLQGDRIYRRYFAQLRAGFADVDLSDCPDLGPVLMALAAACHGGRFTGTKRLKIKESDRAATIQQELQKMNCRVKVSENEVLVFPGISRPEQVLDGHNDHRIVMTLSVLLTLTGGSIRGAEAVSKSLPDFFEKLKALGIGLSFT